MVRQRIAAALREASPGQALRTLVVLLSQEGNSKDAIYHFLEEHLLWLRQQETTSEPDEDVLLDVMDALTGDCHPAARLLPDESPATSSTP